MSMTSKLPEKSLQARPLSFQVPNLPLPSFLPSLFNFVIQVDHNTFPPTYVLLAHFSPKHLIMHAPKHIPCF